MKEMKLPSEFICLDLLVGSPVRSIDYWTGFSKSDVNGDATVAPPEKGRVIFEAVVDAFLRLVQEFNNVLGAKEPTIIRKVSKN